MKILSQEDLERLALKAGEEGIDFHRLTASEMFGVSVTEVTHSQRRVAKTHNMSFLYSTPKKLSEVWNV